MSYWHVQQRFLFIHFAPFRVKRQIIIHYFCYTVYILHLKKFKWCSLGSTIAMHCSFSNTYRISLYSFRGSYSILNLQIVANSNSCRNISFLHLINWIFAAETIQGRKLFKGGNYMRKYGKHSFVAFLENLNFIIIDGQLAPNRPIK